MPNKKKRTKRKALAKRIVPKKKAARKRAASSKSSVARKRKKSPLRRPRTPGQRSVETVTLRSEESPGRRGKQSGDLQGLSGRLTAGSESVEELLEEGNVREAEILQGVEKAGDADQGEVRTKQVPENDVPEEYLDKDQ